MRIITKNITGNTNNPLTDWKIIEEKIDVKKTNQGREILQWFIIDQVDP